MVSEKSKLCWSPEDGALIIPSEILPGLIYLFEILVRVFCPSLFQFEPKEHALLSLVWVNFYIKYLVESVVVQSCRKRRIICLPPRQSESWHWQLMSTGGGVRKGILSLKLHSLEESSNRHCKVEHTHPPPHLSALVLTALLHAVKFLLLSTVLIQ